MYVCVREREYTCFGRSCLHCRHTIELCNRCMLCVDYILTNGIFLFSLFFVCVLFMNRGIPSPTPHTPHIQTDLECKRRWTGLREKYRREKILNYKQRRLGQVVDITQRWRNYMNMMFLDQVYTPRGLVVFMVLFFHT